MDEATNPQFKLAPQLKRGDIIKIMRYDYVAYNIAAYGIVVDEERLIQVPMFPTVEVFMFDHRAVERVPANIVTVISRA